MLKKILLRAFIAGYVMMPLLAHSWSLTTRVNSSGGQLQVRDYAAQTTSGSVVMKSYTTHRNIPVTLTASQGYAITNVQINGAYVALPGSPATYQMGLTTYPGVASQSLGVWFNKTVVPVSMVSGAGGTVSPSGTLSLQYGAIKSYVITPGAGNSVVAISGLPAGARIEDAATLSSVTLPYAVNKAIKVTITVPASAVSMTAYFNGVKAIVGAPQTAAIGSTVTLDGSGSSVIAGGGTMTYAWVQTAGPPVTLNGAATATPSFLSSLSGYYTFKLSVSNGTYTDSASAYVTIDTATEAIRKLCVNCHQGVGVGTAANVYGNWSSSIHAAKFVMCANCHVGADTGGHPGPPLSTLGNVCMNCHLDGSGTVAGHPVLIGTNTCTSCHNAHSTSATGGSSSAHFNNSTSTTNYPASYVTSHAACADCHNTDAANPTIRIAWAQSGHGAINDKPWMKYDFKTMTGCVECHTTTGFITYSTGKVTTGWGVASDRTKEVLTCKGCHKDVVAGVVRTVTPVRPFADDDYANRNVGVSNICMDCHSGKNNGKSIAVHEGVADFTNLSFVAPHYMTAGGTLHGKSGYHFPGQTYAFYSSNSHRLIGSGNFNGSGAGGPCVACHKNSTSGHTFKAAVTGMCSNCHRTSLTDAELQARKSELSNAINILGATLADKGLVYQSTYPHFANKDWGFDRAGANRMGAAFNYALLLSEPGAYTHNSAYAKKLIADSIDAAYNGGTVTGSIDAALANLVAKGPDNGGITQEQADGFQSFRTSNNCSVCHNPGLGGPHATHLNSSISCAVCHSSSAMTNTSLVPGTLAHANGVLDVIPAPGLGNYNTTTGICSALYCHSDGTSLKTGESPAASMSWGAATMTCTSCHGLPPAYASAGHKANSHTRHAGFGCNSCHAGTSSDGVSVTDKTLHANHSYDLQPGAGASFAYTFDQAGGTCSAISCHGNGTATWGVQLGCDGCHGAPPATASHLKHYGGAVAQAGYGNTGSARDVTPDATAYIMNCGNCHPMDATRHGNGAVEVELYNQQAPAGSLKALNPASASYVPGDASFPDDRGLSYTKGTCSNIYCHSYKSWTTPTGVPSSTSCNPSVPADMVTTTNYKTVTWGGPPLDCAGCHANPPQTNYYAGNGGAAGDSHSWLSDDFGWGSIEFLHSNNMYSETGNSSPISCMYCHSDTVRQQNSFTRIAEPNPAAPGVLSFRASMSNVPIYNFATHVNGTNNVAFEKQIAVPTIIDGDELTGSVWTGQKLTNASYEPATKTCSNVACHLTRTNITWGTPYKGGAGNDCLRCHEDNYGGGVCPDAATADSHQPTIFSAPPTQAAPGYQYRYAVNAAQLSGGVLTSSGLIYSLGTHPEGMTISPAGVVTWIPAELGSADVEVLVGSGGLPTTQYFTISVVNPEVVITSTPVTTATAWSSYRDSGGAAPTVRAKIPSGMPAATYTLTTSPTGMGISSTSGVITWTPTDSHVGSVPVTVTVTSDGYSSSQSFTITVDPSPITFTSSPGSPQLTLPAAPYTYTAVATKSGGGTITYSLLTKPLTGMTINSSTGVLTWNPLPALPAYQMVTILATSSDGYKKRQTFTIVTQLATPKFAFTSAPVTTAKVGVPYTYTVTGTKYDVGTLSYAVTGSGVTINAATGVVTCTPTNTTKKSVVVTARIANPTTPVAVATQSFDIEVNP